MTDDVAGIGRAVALAFAREGADIAIAYLNEHEDAKVREHCPYMPGQQLRTACSSWRHRM